MSDLKKEKFRADYTTLVQPIFRYLYYKCGDRQLAEDLAQDVFVNYWKKIDTVKAGGEEAYIYQIARNLLKNHINRQQIVLRFRQQNSESNIVENPQFTLEKKEFKKRLEHEITSLPEGQRVVFLMHRMDGLKYREIAERLGISQKAVEKRMHQALIKLRGFYKNL